MAYEVLLNKSKRGREGYYEDRIIKINRTYFKETFMHVTAI